MLGRKSDFENNNGNSGNTVTNPQGNRTDEHPVTVDHNSPDDDLPF